jgi:hypothetical protein
MHPGAVDVAMRQAIEEGFILDVCFLTPLAATM